MRQLIILAQATVIITGGYSAMRSLDATVRGNNAFFVIFRSEHSAAWISAFVLLHSLPHLIFISAITLAAFWWLSEQKKSVETINSDFDLAAVRVFCIRRWKLVGVITVIVIAVLVLLLELQNFQI